MILTRAFSPGPGADLESHAPGRAPDCAGLSIDGIRKKVERVFLSDWWRSPRHVANWNLNGSGNSDVAPNSNYWQPDFLFQDLVLPLELTGLGASCALELAG